MDNLRVCFLLALVVVAAAGTSTAAPASDLDIRLQTAAIIGDQREVRQLLDKGADPNARYLGGRTPLMYASANANTGVVKLLVTRGAYVNLTDDEGMNALLMASSTTPLHPDSVPAGTIGQVMSRAKQRVETIEALLSAGAQVDSRDNRGATALLAAACAGNIHLIDSLSGQARSRHQREVRRARGDSSHGRQRHGVHGGRQGLA
jgi:ankyrin repeat protein